MASSGVTKAGGAEGAVAPGRSRRGAQKSLSQNIGVFSMRSQTFSLVSCWTQNRCCCNKFLLVQSCIDSVSVSQCMHFGKIYSKYVNGNGTEHGFEKF